MRRGHSLDTVLSLVLFAVFTGSVLLVLMLGVQSYQRVVASMEESYEARTYLQYVATKVAHYSGAEGVSLTQFGDGAALCLSETIDGEDYVTYLYLYDGMAMELFCSRDVELGPEAGFTIMALTALDIAEISPHLFLVSCSGSGHSAQVYVGTGIQEGVVA